MYKEIVISIVVIVLIVILDIITQNFTNEAVAYMEENLLSLKEDLINESSEEQVQEKMEEMLDVWEEKEEKMAYYIEHAELEKIDTELNALKANILVNEYKEGVPELEKCLYTLGNIKEKSEIKVKNIF